MEGTVWCPMTGEGPSGSRYFEKSIMHMLKNHLRRPSLVVTLLFLTMLVRGQFNIAILPTGGIYLKSQLWNVSVSNTGTATVQATLHLDLKDIQTHQTEMSGQSAPFRVGPGVRKVE